MRRVDAEHDVRWQRRLRERHAADRRRRLEAQRLREDAARAHLDEDVLDRGLVDRQADFAVSAASDESALGFDGDLLLAAVGVLDLKTQCGHGASS